MDDRYTIDTPENIEFAYDIAGIGSRFLAAIIDTFLIIVAQVIVFVSAGLILSAFGLDTAGTAPESVILALSTLVGFGILWGYYIAFEAVWNGQSPGKRAIGLRVVREGGRPITFVSSVIRNLIRFADFLPAFYGVGVIAMFIDRRARRLGDLAGGTLVVKERQSVTLESLSNAPTVAPPQPGDPQREITLPNIHALNDQDYDLIQEFLRRRSELGRDARARLGIQLASGLQARLGLPQGGDAERFLQHVAVEYQVFKQQQEVERTLL
ncbi:MAG: RDD family protein [Chloroflexota bacterium]